MVALQENEDFTPKPSALAECYIIFVATREPLDFDRFVQQAQPIFIIWFGRKLRSIGATKEDIEEITLDLIFWLWQHPDHFFSKKQDNPIMTADDYLRMQVYNHAQNFRQKLVRQQGRLLITRIDAGINGSESAGSIEIASKSNLEEEVMRKAVLETCFKHLSPVEQQILDLLLVQGYTSNELQEKLGKKAPTIRKSAQRIREKLITYIKNNDDTLE